jgi:hypothetical protein
MCLVARHSDRVTLAFDVFATDHAASATSAMISLCGPLAKVMLRSLV